MEKSEGKICMEALQEGVKTGFVYGWIAGALMDPEWPLNVVTDDEEEMKDIYAVIHDAQERYNKFQNCGAELKASGIMCMKALYDLKIIEKREANES